MGAGASRWLFGSSKAFLREPQKGFEHAPKRLELHVRHRIVRVQLGKGGVVSELFGGSIEHNFVLIVVDSIKYRLLGLHLESVTR